ncbi:MAG TPA: type IV pilin-like G/H family protein [Allocoleopsis sp.]
MPTVLLIVGGLGCGCFGLLVLLGIIAAIALPSFLSAANKAKEAEAKYYVGAMTRAQQANFLEKGSFSNSIDSLSLGIRPETQNYRYQIVPQPDNKSVMMTAQAKITTLKSYTGAVFAIKKGKEVITVSGICVTDRPATTPPAMPTLSSDGSGSVECSPGSQPANSGQTK